MHTCVKKLYLKATTLSGFDLLTLNRLNLTLFLVANEPALTWCDPCPVPTLIASPVHVNRYRFLKA
jgi:hypothetical protein